MTTFLRLSCLLLAALLLSGCSDERAVSNATADGKRMYRDGVLPSGDPMTAIVAGDVPIVGTQFSCESCHGRSGMGAAEGEFVVPPVAAQFLFNESPQPRRPAYNRASLAQLLRDGITPSGRELSAALMPRYKLDDGDIEVLVSYLETLSAEDSPGVSDSSIRFATIVTDASSAVERQAVAGVVQRFAEDINRQTRNESERWDRGYTPESKLPTVFREWVVDTWMLRGPTESWPHQLERYYNTSPVFAVVGGVGRDSWEPVNAFCETYKVPCLYPSADLPSRNDGDFYTVYFSRGLLLEADLVAAHLAESEMQSAVQVYCDPRVAPVAAALQQSLAANDINIDTVTFGCGEPVPLVSGNAAVVLWLNSAQLEMLPEAMPDARFYVSSTLLDGDSAYPAGAEVFVAHPYRVPGSIDPAMRRFELWARTREVEVTSPRRQAEAYFACLVLNDAVKHMGRFRIREYALDMMDHGESMNAYVPAYPRATFGPGQRFISKGGYVLPVEDGQIVAAGAEWILP